MQTKLRKSIEEIKKLYTLKEDMNRQLELITEIQRLAEILNCHEEVLKELEAYFSSLDTEPCDVDVIIYKNGYEMTFKQDELPTHLSVIEAIRGFNPDILYNIEELACSRMSKVLKITSSNNKPLMLNFIKFNEVTKEEFEVFYNLLGTTIREVVGRW